MTIPRDYKALLLAALLLFAAAGWAQFVETAGIAVGDVRFQVELAVTPEERARGLMFREHLPEGRGMLFIQPSPEPATFWMKNTLIPLDILYFDAGGRLLDIHANVPPCTMPDCPLYRSSAPVKYILEINAGHAARLGLKRGDPLRME